MAVRIEIVEVPIKSAEGVKMTQEQLDEQGRLARSILTPIDYETVRGTCGDERPRVGLKSGEKRVEVRPSAYGGPNTYGLYMAVLSGFFGDSDEDAKSRQGNINDTLNRNGIKSGAHEKCAATEGFPAVLGMIADPVNREVFFGYAKQELGDKFDEELAEEAVAYAAQARDSGIFDEWGEAKLADSLDDDAGEAIEILADVPHEARSVIKIKGDGQQTVPQTELHEATGGEDSFVLTDPYMDRIENALASGPDAHRMKRIMEHARELLNAAVFAAVPNKELHQINLYLP